MQVSTLDADIKSALKQEFLQTVDQMFEEYVRESFEDSENLDATQAADRLAGILNQLKGIKL